MPRGAAMPRLPQQAKVKQCRRDFRKGNYTEIRKRLAQVDWNDKMKNKTAAELTDTFRCKSKGNGLRRGFQKD